MLQHIVLDLGVGCPILKFGHIHIFQRELNPNLFRVDLTLGKQDNRLAMPRPREKVHRLHLFCPIPTLFHQGVDPFLDVPPRGAAIDSEGIPARGPADDALDDDVGTEIGKEENDALHAFLWCHQESNRGHKDFQSFALPTELWHHSAFY